MPEASIKAEHMAGGQQDALLWDELVKISSYQLSKRGQGSGFTSGTHWEWFPHFLSRWL